MLSLTGSEAIGLVTAVLMLASLMAGVIAVLFSQLKKNTNQIIRDENADLRSRLTTVEKERDALKERVAAMEGALAVVTGNTAVAELRGALEGYHEELSRRLDNLFKRRNDDLPVEHDRRRT